MSQPRSLRQHIIMIGMMGAGKTAIGRALADLLAVPFWDSDAEIETAAAATISEVFARDGEVFFREREREVLARLLDGPVGVISTGGGAWIQPRTRELLAARGVVVWLQADLDLLWDRVRRKATRPLLQTPDPYGSLRDLYEARAPIYATAPHHVAAAPDLSIAQMAHRVQAQLSQIDDLWSPA